MTFLFYCTIKILSEDKIDFINTLQIFLQGGVINQLLPSAGHIFRYYKFKNNSNINFAEYTISQSVFSIWSLLSYGLIGFILGLIYISNIKVFSILIILFIFLITFTYRFRYSITSLLKNLIKKIKFMNNIIDDTIKIFYLIRFNKVNFIKIFLGFIILTLSETYAFYMLLDIYEIKITLMLAASIWIATSLISVLAIINFFGLFEAILALSALTIADETMVSMIIIGFTFRFLYLSAQIFLIILTYVVKLLNRRTI